MSLFLQPYPFVVLAPSPYSLLTMANTNLVVAIVFAALFGAAVLWLAIYYLHRFIHRKCCEFGHWFHLLLTHTPEPEDYSHERANNTVSSSYKSRSTRHSRSDKAKPRSEKRHRSRRSSPGDRIRERVQKWSVETEDSEPVDAVNHQEDEYRPAQFEWEDPMEVSSELFRSNTDPAMDAEPRRPVMPQITPPLPLSMPPAISPRIASASPYVQSHIKERRPEENRLDTEPVATLQSDMEPGKTDFIHICDEYPSMVLEALKQQRDRSKSSSDSVSSSGSSISTQQIVRAYIPRSAPRAAFQFPQYPHVQARLYKTAPTSYPRQWMDSGGQREAAPLRYAPYTRTRGRRKLRSADRAHLAPSNAPP
jgi:hypothetical protein